MDCHEFAQRISESRGAPTRAGVAAIATGAKRNFVRGKKLANLIAAAREIFAQEPHVRIDYIEIVDPDRLDPADQIERSALVAVAAYVEPTRPDRQCVLNNPDSDLAG